MSLSTYYSVSIAQIVANTVADANAAGFVDRVTVQQYMANNGGIAPTNVATSINKTRENIRYKNIVENLQLMGNVYISNTIATGANVSASATTFSFTLESERGDETLTTIDELNTANTLTGANAIVRCVARGLNETRANYVAQIYDPTITLPVGPANSSGLANSAVRVGWSVITFNIDGLTNSVVTAANSITVTQIVI